MNTHGTARSRFRDLRLVVGLVGVAVVGTVIAAGTASALNNDGAAESTVDAPVVSCPDVAGQLPDVPAEAADDVAAELTALQNQINEANGRLTSSQGQGGPAFIDNAILGPLADKRTATLERIEIAIGRHAERPTGLTALADCDLAAGADQTEDPGAGEGSDAGQGGDADGDQGGDTDAGNDNGNGGGAVDEEDTGAGDAPPPGDAPTVSCPDVAGQLPDVPAEAADDVAAELTALQNQINEANGRLTSSQGQGGPAFIDNAILGPLADKRTATLERIEIAIGRHAERPTGLTALAECDLS